MHLQKRDEVTTIPVPIVVNTSGTFDGNDGKWSTFYINVNSDSQGLHGQNFKVLIFTSSPMVLVPGSTEWCVTKECAEQRGILISSGGQQLLGMEKSGSWMTAGLFSIPVPDWYSQDLVQGNMSLRGEWGSTNVGLGLSDESSPVLQDIYIAWYIFKDYYLGSFGLAMGSVGGDGATKPTFLTQFKSVGKIASISYGYTAGAWYRNNEKGAPGNLVLGGYDKSRMTDKTLSLHMPNDQTYTLEIGIPSIIYSSNPGVAVNPTSFTTQGCTGFRANIDSMLPFLILPDCICDQFEATFGLKYDETQNLYFVNASSHERNKQQNGTVAFKIAEGPTDSGRFTSVELGYSAFDHSWTPVGGNTSNYFPIKKSKRGVYTLGRTFLQEAYIIVDYENLNFTVAPVYYADPMPQQKLVSIYNQTTNPTARSSGGGLAPGAIAGAVIGIVVAFVIAGIVAVCCWRKRNTKKEAAQKSYQTRQIDPTLAGQEVKYRRVSELTGSDLPNSPITPLTGYYSVDHKSVPPISEMSPDSPPVELYSPPPESASDVGGGGDYFTPGKPHRRSVQRDHASSGQNTPGTPIAELPGDEGQCNPGVSPLNSPLHSRGPSDTSLSTNIDERLAGHKEEATTSRPTHPAETAAAGEAVGPKNETKAEATTVTIVERRPSNQRGLSQTTIASDSTAVSQPTPEEQIRWASKPPLGG
ncbi:acid protease [Didymella exigua CBS 183.55]|uniref:Acid protease n=1 Tax=Didymella exigua CBS 183.55 TaxID=1150837 RepID=A0A6A5RA42_9PLEO|nr:acid protease [Didymella exigua CBS 183.55]KAF1924199.1 acid protease [Didymella exigua CBS 183.55]